MCPGCGDSPSTVIMDGVSLGIRKAFMPWKKYLENKDTTDRVFDGSSNTSRIFIQNAETRRMLLKYVKDVVSYDEYKILKGLIDIHAPSLGKLLTDFWDEGFTKCPAAYSEFIKTLASNYPVCGFIHYNPEIFRILKKIDSFTSDECLLLGKEVPLLASILNSLEWKVPPNLRNILKLLVDMAVSPFSGLIHDTGTCDDACECRGHGFFPLLPVVSHRGKYRMDCTKKKEDIKCTKTTHGHKSLIPGLFTVSCIHGICYGYEIMEDAESPNTPFTVLRTRFHKAPKMIIYDNACNLQQYCLNRDPVFFRDSWFLVDRFHWCNHVGCHSGYSIDRYPHLASINSQVAEQRNSLLKKLRTMLSYMNLKNFKSHCNLYFWFRNMLSLSRLKNDLNLQDYPLFLELSKVYTTSKPY